MKTKAKESFKKETAKKTTVKKTAEKKTVSPGAKRGKAKRVAFSVRAKEGSKVFLAGSFNDWNPTAKEMTDKMGDGVFVAVVNLSEGMHEYKFVIDGIWCADPECSDWVQNDHGTLNSVKHVE